MPNDKLDKIIIMQHHMKPNYQIKKTTTFSSNKNQTHITNHGEIIKNAEKSQFKTKQIN